MGWVSCSPVLLVAFTLAAGCLLRRQNAGLDGSYVESNMAFLMLSNKFSPDLPEDSKGLNLGPFVCTACALPASYYLDVM